MNDIKYTELYSSIRVCLRENGFIETEPYKLKFRLKDERTKYLSYKIRDGVPVLLNYCYKWVLKNNLEYNVKLFVTYNTLRVFIKLPDDERKTYILPFDSFEDFVDSFEFVLNHLESKDLEIAFNNNKL